MKPLKTLPLLLTALALAGTASAQKTGLHVTNKFPIKSNGGYDYITVDAEGKRLFVSHGTQVNILSTSGDSLGIIGNTLGVHGITLVKSLGKGYTSNGKANNSTVFDLKTYRPITTIVTGTNPDATFYDEFSKKVYMFNGKSENATVIDPATDKVIATIPLGGKPETGVSDGKGHVFVNSETTNEVIVINDNTFKVEKRYKLSGEEPSGLAIDVATNRLFVGCSGSGNLVVLDAANGKQLAKFKTGDCDGVAFDPALKLAYSSNREGTLSVIKEISADKFAKVEDVITEPNAKTIAVDLLTHKIYLPAAKTEKVAASASNIEPRPKQIPNSFHVIEVGK